MRLRDIKFFLRGTVFMKPIPDHRDLRCWLAGQAATCWAIVVAIPIALVAGGFAAGRYF